MKTINKIIIALAGIAFVACSDFLDTQSPSYDSGGIYESEAGLKEGVVGIYNLLYMEGTFTNSLHRPAVVTIDNFTGLSMERAQNTTIGAGLGCTPDNSSILAYWSGLYKLVARANAVIYGASGNIENMSDEAKRYYAEARVLRAYAYYNLVVAFGDVPFFTKPATTEDYNASRTSRQTVMDFVIEELGLIAEEMPWTATERGRVDRAVAYGLQARAALFAGSLNFGGKAMDYFRTAANAANRVIGQRDLAKNFADLFTKEGQTKSDVRNEMLWELMYSDQMVNNTNKYHWVALGNGPRMFAQTGQHPGSLLADTYECIDGLRIDESPLYDPKAPNKNRDPRFGATLKMHGDTIDYYTASGTNKFIVEAFANQTQMYNAALKRWMKTNNPDVNGTAAWTSFVSNGCGYLWYKYVGGLTEDYSTVTCNIAIMRYAEILLTYAEAKIELGELDDTVYDAINKVRLRAGMPEVSSDRKGNIDKMRQLVRRERKVELAMEGLHFADMRRWQIGDLENSKPSYGAPLSTVTYAGMEATDIPNFKTSDRHDLNDIASYDAYSDKLHVRDQSRYWDDKFYLWPIPQSERNKDPNLTQNPGYNE